MGHKAADCPARNGGNRGGHGGRGGRGGKHVTNNNHGFHYNINYKPKKYCEHHGQNLSHTTEECLALARLRANEASGSNSIAPNQVNNNASSKYQGLHNNSHPEGNACAKPKISSITGKRKLPDSGKATSKKFILKKLKNKNTQQNVEMEASPETYNVSEMEELKEKCREEIKEIEMVDLTIPDSFEEVAFGASEKVEKTCKRSDKSEKDGKRTD